MLGVAVLGLAAYDADFAPHLNGWRNLYDALGWPQAPEITYDEWQPGRPFVLHIRNRNMQYEVRNAPMAVIVWSEHRTPLDTYWPDRDCCIISLPAGGTISVTLRPQRIKPAFIELERRDPDIRWWPVRS